MVEPNIKDGKGGLRDLHTLFWIGKYFYRVKTSAELVDKGVLSAEEYRLFQRAEDFLWAIRCNLHFLTGRADEKLTFEVQPDLAARLRFADRPGMLGVERMMKRYFLVAKDVGDLTRIFCTSLEFDHAKPLDMMGRVAGMFKRGRVAIKGEPDFVIDSGRLNTASPETFEKDLLDADQELPGRRGATICCSTPTPSSRCSARSAAPDRPRRAQRPRRQ